MSVEYPFKITVHNDLVLVDLPKTPEKYLEKGILFKASNGVRIASSHTQAYYEEDAAFYIRGVDDNHTFGTLVIGAAAFGRMFTAKQAEALKTELQTALDEFVARMNEQDEPVTRLDVFKDLFPDSSFYDSGYPKCCPNDIFPTTDRTYPCGECMKQFWNEPAPEKFQKKE